MIIPTTLIYALPFVYPTMSKGTKVSEVESSSECSSVPSSSEVSSTPPPESAGVTSASSTPVVALNEEPGCDGDGGVNLEVRGSGCQAELQRASSPFQKINEQTLSAGKKCTLQNLNGAASAHIQRVVRAKTNRPRHCVAASSETTVRSAPAPALPFDSAAFSAPNSATSARALKKFATSARISRARATSTRSRRPQAPKKAD